MGFKPCPSGTRALGLLSPKGQVSNVNLIWVLRPSYLLLIWDLPPLAEIAEVPLSYFRQSQGCLACSPEQAQSALKAHIPCQTLSLSADSHIYGCVLCQGGDCFPSCQDASTEPHCLTEFWWKLLLISTYSLPALPRNQMWIHDSLG